MRNRASIFLSIVAALSIICLQSTGIAGATCTTIGSQQVCENGTTGESTVQPLTTGVEGENCVDADGNPTICNAQQGPPSISSPQTLNPECDKLFNLSAGTTAAWDNKYLTPTACQAYVDLYNNHYTPGPKSNSGFSCPGTWSHGCPQGITGLNPTFAENLDKAYHSGLSAPITSAYRTQSVQTNQIKDGADDSSHIHGCAVDLSYNGSTCTSADCKWVTGNGGANSIQVRAAASKCALGELTAECNHIEPTGTLSSGALAQCKTSKPFGGGAPATLPPGTYVAGQGNGSGTKVIAPQTLLASNCTVTDLGNGVKQYSGTGCDSLKNSTYKACASSGSGGFLGSLFGGGNSCSGSGGGTDMGTMMKLMMGMQLGQGLGGLFSGMFGGSSNPAATQPQSAQNPITPLPTTNPVSPSSTGNSPIDTLLTQLGTTGNTNPVVTNTATTATSSVSVSTTDVGQLDALTPFPDEVFVHPSAGVAPLAVVAHFQSGLSCADAYDLSWGDGSTHETLAYQAPAGGVACQAIATVHDISHTYQTPGTYLVSLAQGKTLSHLSTTTVVAIASSTDITGALNAISIQLDNASASIAEASSTGSVSALGNAFGFLQNAFGTFVQFFANLFHGTSDTATTTPMVLGHDITIGTGALAQPGDSVSILYTAYVGLVATSTVFDSTAFYGNEPFSFDLGTTTVISGLQIGIDGMKAGGERLITIPPELAYGSEALTNASGTVIVPANATVIFDVQLQDVSTTTGN